MINDLMEYCYYLCFGLVCLNLFDNISLFLELACVYDTFGYFGRAMPYLYRFCILLVHTLVCTLLFNMDMIQLISALMFDLDNFRLEFV